MTKVIVTLDPVKNQASAACLAMWKALEHYDPAADSWSDPSPRETPEARESRAESLRPNAASDAEGLELGRSYLAAIERLKRGEPWLPSDRTLRESLQARALRLAQDALSRNQSTEAS